MNRHERRKQQRVRRRQVAVMESMYDIGVDARYGHIVMIFANAKGRKVVEDLWPDVRWETDEVCARAHSSDWLFTHVRVTKLPPHLEERAPLAFASSDALGLAVAIALQRFSEPRRVAHYTGNSVDDVKVNLYDGAALAGGKDSFRSLLAEYAPSGLECSTS